MGLSRGMTPLYFSPTPISHTVGLAAKAWLCILNRNGSGRSSNGDVVSSIQGFTSVSNIIQTLLQQLKRGVARSFEQTKLDREYTSVKLNPL
jgi:hypothetical protein